MCKTSHSVSTDTTRDINSNIQDVDPKKTTEQINEMISRSSVIPFYAGKSIFMTGATGFCGKVIVHFLLLLLLLQLIDF